MKAISLWQPWASLIPLGIKKVETRSWGTKYKGDLLICSALKRNRELENYYYNIFWYPLQDNRDLPRYTELYFGYAVAICTLDDCFIMTRETIAKQSELELMSGDWKVGRYAWVLTNIRHIESPFKVKGQQGLFDVKVDI